MYPYSVVDLEKVNTVFVKQNPNLVRDTFEVFIENSFPRPVPGSFRRWRAKKGRAPWSIPISLFKDYLADTDVTFSLSFSLGTFR
jgi:hypothetical protein